MKQWALILLLLPSLATAAPGGAAPEDQRTRGVASPTAAAERLQAVAEGEAASADAEAGIDTLRRAIERARRAGHKQHVVDMTGELVKVLESAGRHREALEALKSVEAINREITRETRERAVLELQARYDNERKSREIARLAAQNRARQAELDARSWRQRLWAVLALTLALAAVLLVQWLTRSRRINHHLERANASLVEESTHDSLTGACNRRHFEQLMERTAGAGPGFGLMVLDLDHFKRINDELGHEAGDAVLVDVTQRLRRLLREQDTVVRWGGEEFVLVLPGTSAAGMATLSARVLNLIGGAPVAHRNRGLAVTVSAGCAMHPAAPGATWEHAFRLADAAMYLSKQSGRNRATCVTALDVAAGGTAFEDLLKAQREGRVALQIVSGPWAPAAAEADALV